MKSTSKLLIATGLLLTIAGTATGVKYTIDKESRVSNPAVRKYANACEEYQKAMRELKRIPEHERMDYIPQKQRYDYSVSQAHSRVEQAYQKVGSAKANCEEIVNNEPEVKSYVDETKSGASGFLVGLGGLLLTYMGFKRK